MEIVNAGNWCRPIAVGMEGLTETVAAILADIRVDGAQALCRYSLKFDGFEPRKINLAPWESYPLDASTKRHLKIAADRIERFGRMQMDMYQDREMRDEFGRFGQRIVPLETMAAYIPGGRFPLVSTALMTLLPARIAGVERRVAISPSNHPGILAAASLAGATEFIQIGGVQAIGALAYGCPWADAVDMIVGPGNAYVNEAKSQIQGRVKIDTLAGPSEILILCDQTCQPQWLALDVLAQAEHDPRALSVIAGTDRAALNAIGQAVQTHSEKNPDKDTGIIQLVYCPSEQALVDFANHMAPEHLQVTLQLDEDLLLQLKHYGSLFIGPKTAVALGDYCTGPNHTLPTLGMARKKGGLFVGDFVKVLTYQEIEGDSFAQLAETGIDLATLEGLEFHRQSLKIRVV